jgi:HAD superfamily hydrolase (TIGR01549 family)
MKLLFTSVGRRVELIQAFRNAALSLKENLIIYGTDISNTAPALLFCDHPKIVCRIDNPNYISELLNLCKKEKIEALIPTIDTDLLVLSQNKKEFEKIGVKVFISSEEKIRICRDKRFTSEYFTKIGLVSPKTCDDYLNYFNDFPCFIKPLNGSSSISTFKINNREELKVFAGRVGNYIIQPYIEGTEYTIDIFCDYEGNPVHITPRKRIAVRSGEVLKTEITLDKKIIEECKIIINDFKPCGALAVQMIRKENVDYFIEINPRFGGGAPLSMKAGADSAKAVLEIIKNEKLNYRENVAIDGAIYSRFDQSIQIAEKVKDIKAFVFDLDDTLYSEKEYVKSGFREVSKCLPNIENAFEKLWTAFEERKPSIDYLLESEGIYSEDVKKTCIETYRLHRPNIHLYSGIIEMFAALRNKGFRLGIITDGRPEGQRAKIEVLGLSEMVDEIIITDELGGAQFRKPCDIAFRIMKERLGVDYGEMAYVGDNPTKDFIAPRALGMRTIYFQNDDGIYSVKSPKNGALVELISDYLC